MVQPVAQLSERLTESLRQHSKFVLVALSYLLVLVFGVVDYLTGPTISVSVLYLIPVVLITWNVGRGNGIVVAAASAVVWLAANSMWSVVYLHPAVPYWNAVMRFGVFLILVLVVSQVKTANERLRHTVADKTENLITELAERKRAEQELQRSHEQLRQLAARLEMATEDERMRTAREIHDELGQTLTGLKMDVTWLEQKLPKEARKLRGKTRSIAGCIDSAIQAVRRISTELRPALLDNLGLVAALEWEAQDFQKRWGIKCEFNSQFEDLQLDRDRAIAIFRIFQETLTNVARHAGATHVKATLHEKNDCLTLEVNDNGRGISQEELSDPKSLGLLGMRERALALRGSVEITGEPGDGTTVTLVAPLGQVKGR